MGYALDTATDRDVLAHLELPGYPRPGARSQDPHLNTSVLITGRTHVTELQSPLLHARPSADVVLVVILPEQRELHLAPPFLALVAAPGHHVSAVDEQLEDKEGQELKEGTSGEL